MPEHSVATELLTVGEVARRVGIATSAVRFYESEGLISSVRTSGNQRRYPRHTLRRLSIVVFAKRLGIPLAEVAEVFASLPGDRMPGKRDWARISARWSALLEERRLQIQRLEKELAGCIGCGCLSLNTCTALNPGDALATEGAGPQRLLHEQPPADEAPRPQKAREPNPAEPRTTS